MKHIVLTLSLFAAITSDASAQIKPRILTRTAPFPARLAVEAVVFLARACKSEQSPPTIQYVGPIVPSGTCLVSKHRIKDVVLEQSEVDTFLGATIPGRSIKVRVRVDVELQCWLELGQVRTEMDPDFPDTFRVVLPAITKVVPAFPDDELADYKVQYGALTIRNPERAKEMRRALYRAALDAAGRETWRMSGLKEQTRAQLQQSLRNQFPGKRISVEWSDK